MASSLESVLRTFVTVVERDGCGDRARRNDAYRVRLTPLGPLGIGDVGPNPSGLFTPFHPKTAPGSRPWTEASLAEWTRNPRAARPTTTMPPVAPLAEGDWRRLVAELRGTGER